MINLTKNKIILFHENIKIFSFIAEKFYEYD
jgi:hypothetical protein